MLVATKPLSRQNLVCCNKCLSRQTHVCRDKQNSFRNKSFVATKDVFACLLRKKKKKIVATKMIFMAARANDSCAQTYSFGRCEVWV